MLKALKNFFTIVQVVINAASLAAILAIAYLLYNPQVALKFFAGGIGGVFH